MMIALGAVLGLLIGSFLNVCIARLPKSESIIRPPSHCPNCQRPVRWYENIPIVSWVALRARCAGCGQPISWQYPLVELITGVIWAASFAAFEPFNAVRVAVFATVLLGISITDYRHYVIPDAFTVFGLGWCLATAFAGTLIGDIGPFAGVYEALIGACVGAGAIAIAGWLGEIALRKEAMGFGDVTLMAVVGAALGPGRALATVFVGALLGAIVFLLVVYPIVWARARARQTPFAAPLVPFGVFLAPAAVLTLLWGNDFLRWYGDLMVMP